MKAKYEWTEKLDDGARRTYRVSFPGPGRIRWQSKHSDEEAWVYDIVPTPEEWAVLLDHAERRYRRRQAPYKELELIRRLTREAATSSALRA